MEYLTVEDVARRLKVSPFTVRRWLREDTLRGVRIGGRGRVSEVELARFIGEQEGKAVA